MLPTVVVVKAQVDLDEWPPLGSFGFADEPHGRFLRCAVGLLSVTGNAGTDDILPSGWPTAVARDDVIQVQIFAVVHLAAVLASVLVPLENIVPRELDLLLRQPIEHHEQNHARDANTERDGADAFWMW